MLHQATLDTIADGSTLEHQKSERPLFASPGEKFVPMVKDSLSQGRHYTDVMMDGRITGPKDSKNKVLQVKTPHVQTIRHSVEKSHNEGDFRLGKKDRPVTRKGLPLIPVGCNGPVFCPKGIAMRNVITQHDPDVPVHAATHEQFTHGGVKFADPMKPNSMMGAAGSLPVDGPAHESLQNAQGLHYATEIPPATKMVNHSGHNSAVPFGGEAGNL